MPIYEYQCQDCNNQLEVLQKINDAPLEDCPACGKASLKKKISAAAFRLKGSGWYETDFKTSGKKNLASDDKSPPSSGDSSGDKSGDKGGDEGSGKSGDAGSSDSKSKQTA